MSADPLPFPGPATVTDLFERLSAAIAAAGLDEVTVTGRLTGWRRSPTWGQGDLVDVAGARLPLGLPGHIAAAVEARCRQAGTPLIAEPAVTVAGRLDVHPRYGPLRLVVATLHVDRQATAANAAQRAAALDHLAATGTFTHQQRLRLPVSIERVGVIGGAASAARADFRDRISHHEPPITVHELDVPTSGPHAAGALAAGIARLAGRRLDTIVVLRGGGPVAGLAPFDDPELAGAIARCPVPILTGIGHATNATLADRAAHLALPTPSAAADHIVRHNAAQRFAQVERSATDAHQRAARARLAAATHQHHADQARRRLRLALALAVLIAAAAVLAATMF